MNSRKIALFFGALSFSLSVNAATPKNHQELVTQFKEAAKICGGDCRAKCSSAAKQLQDWGQVSGHKSEVTQLSKDCSKLLFMDSIAMPAPNKSSVYVALLTASMSMDTIAAAEQKAAPAPPPKSKISLADLDTNIRTASGDLDMGKTQKLFHQIPGVCADGVKGPIVRGCEQQCKKEAKELDQRVADIQPENEMSTDYYSIYLLLSGNAGCLSYFTAPSYKNENADPTVVDAVKALETAGVDVKDRKWPVKEKTKPSLGLGDLAVAKTEETLGDKLKQIKAIDAVDKLTFDNARAMLIATPEYKTIAAEAKQNGFSLQQVKAAMHDLNEAKDTADSTKWQQKALEFSDYGSKAELVAALTRTCDKAYLQEFKDDSLWLVPNDRSGFNVNYQLPSAYLQRLCFQQLLPQLEAEFDTKSDMDHYQKLAATYASSAPISGRATCRDCPPDRVMSDAQWLPKLHVDIKQAVTAATQQKNAALVAEQQKKRQQAMQEQQLAEAKQQAENKKVSDASSPDRPMKAQGSRNSSNYDGFYKFCISGPFPYYCDCQGRSYDQQKTANPGLTQEDFLVNNNNYSQCFGPGDTIVSMGERELCMNNYGDSSSPEQCACVGQLVETQVMQEIASKKGLYALMYNPSVMRDHRRFARAACFR